MRHTETLLCNLRHDGLCEALLLRLPQRKVPLSIYPYIHHTVNELACLLLGYQRPNIKTSGFLNLTLVLLSTYNPCKRAYCQMLTNIILKFQKDIKTFQLKRKLSGTLVRWKNRYTYSLSSYRMKNCSILIKYCHLAKYCNTTTDKQPEESWHVRTR